jgi:hypothetical protein
VTFSYIFLGIFCFVSYLPFEIVEQFSVDNNFTVTVVIVSILYRLHGFAYCDLSPYCLYIAAVVHCKVKYFLECSSEVHCANVQVKCFVQVF